MKSIILLLSMLIMENDHNLLIADFKIKGNIAEWNVVDDGVMGGLSQGALTITTAGNALYSGTVRTENNGGFSSIRYGFSPKDVSAYAFVMLRVKGDGKSYQFRLKGDRSQRYSYISSFTTSGAWETIELPLSEFYPSFRGNTLNQPNFPGDTIEEIAILIGNKTKEAFALEIEKIHLE